MSTIPSTNFYRPWDRSQGNGANSLQNLSKGFVDPTAKYPSGRPLNKDSSAGKGLSGPNGGVSGENHCKHSSHSTNMVAPCTSRSPSSKTTHDSSPAIDTPGRSQLSPPSEHGSSNSTPVSALVANTGISVAEEKPKKRKHHRRTSDFSDAATGCAERRKGAAAHILRPVGPVVAGPDGTDSTQVTTKSPVTPRTHGNPSDNFEVDQPSKKKKKSKDLGEERSDQPSKKREKSKDLGEERSDQPSKKREKSKDLGEERSEQPSKKRKKSKDTGEERSDQSSKKKEKNKDIEGERSDQSSKKRKKSKEIEGERSDQSSKKRKKSKDIEGGRSDQPLEKGNKSKGKGKERSYSHSEVNRDTTSMSMADNSSIPASSSSPEVPFSRSKDTTNREGIVTTESQGLELPTASAASNDFSGDQTRPNKRSREKGHLSTSSLKELKRHRKTDSHPPPSRDSSAVEIDTYAGYQPTKSPTPGPSRRSKGKSRQQTPPNHMVEPESTSGGSINILDDVPAGLDEEIALQSGAASHGERVLQNISSNIPRFRCQTMPPFISKQPSRIVGSDLTQFEEVIDKALDRKFKKALELERAQCLAQNSSQTTVPLVANNMPPPPPPTSSNVPPYAPGGQRLDNDQLVAIIKDWTLSGISRHKRAEYAFSQKGAVRPGFYHLRNLVTTEEWKRVRPKNNRGFYGPE